MAINTMNDSKLVPIGKAAEYLGQSTKTLRAWDKSGKLPAFRSAGGHRLYVREDLERFQADLYALARVWAGSAVAPEISKDYYCNTSDRFKARLEHMAIIIGDTPTTPGVASLVIAVAGEIGNNSFDHNLGNWPDVPGVFFAYDVNRRVIVLADRGVGIRATLSRVRDNLRDDIDALRVAMTERVSGRAPEQRGNGLKFVAKVVGSNPIGITLQSGIAVATIEKGGVDLGLALAGGNIRGVLARIEY